MSLLSLLRGCEVTVWLKDGSVYDGVLGESDSVQLRVRLSQLRSTASRNTNPFEDVAWNMENIQMIQCLRVDGGNVNMGNAEFRTDAQISNEAEVVRERELEKWTGMDQGGEFALEEEIREQRRTSGMMSWDQFSAPANQASKQYVPYTDECYTTTIDKDFYKKVEKEADKIAREIERQYSDDGSGKSGMRRDRDGAMILKKESQTLDENEEDLFSTVQADRDRERKRFYNSAKDKEQKETPAVVSGQEAPAVSSSYASAFKSNLASNTSNKAAVSSAVASSNVLPSKASSPSGSPIQEKDAQSSVPTKTTVTSAAVSSNVLPPKSSGPSSSPVQEKVHDIRPQNTASVTAATPNSATLPTKVTAVSPAIDATIKTDITSDPPANEKVPATTTTEKPKTKLKFNANAAAFVPSSAQAPVAVVPTAIPYYEYPNPQLALPMQPVPVYYPVDAYGYPVPAPYYNSGYYPEYVPAHVAHNITSPTLPPVMHPKTYHDKHPK